MPCPDGCVLPRGICSAGCMLRGVSAPGGSGPGRVSGHGGWGWYPSMH